jgi:hypothetical protein
LRLEFNDPEEFKIAGYALECSQSKFRTRSRSSSISISKTNSSEEDEKEVIKEKNKIVSNISNDEEKEFYSIEKSVHNSESAKAVMNKEIIDPIAGTWILSIATQKATGELSAKINLK